MRLINKSEQSRLVENLEIKNNITNINPVIFVGAEFAKSRLFTFSLYFAH